MRILDRNILFTNGEKSRAKGDGPGPNRGAQGDDLGPSVQTTLKMVALILALPGQTHPQ